MKRKKIKNREIESNAKKDIKEKVGEILEIPQEILMDIPKMVLIGNKTLTIENYKGIIEYTEKLIRVNTKSHMIKLTGNKLEIKTITAEELIVIGDILTLEFIA